MPSLPFTDAEKAKFLELCQSADPGPLERLLDEQDGALLKAAAKVASVPTINCLLDRKTAYANGQQVVAEAAAGAGNSAVFRHITQRNPRLPMTNEICLNAIDGGVDTWKAILKVDHACIDREFGHFGDPVGMTVQSGNATLLAYLLSEGPDIKHSHVAHKPVLAWAKKYGSSQEIIDLLIRHGAPTNESVYS